MKMKNLMKSSNDSILKDNIIDSGIHNKAHNFMTKTLNEFNIIHIPATSIIRFHEGKIITQKSYGNFKVARIMRKRPDQFGLHERRILSKSNNKIHSILYISRYKNHFKLQNTLIEED